MWVVVPSLQHTDFIKNLDLKMNELHQIRNPTHTQGISKKYPNVEAYATVQSSMESGDCTAREVLRLLLRKSSERAWNMNTTMSYEQETL
jgi:hypothetical protein